MTDASGRVVGFQNGCKLYEVKGLVFALAGLAKADAVDVVEELKNAKPLIEQGTGKPLPLDSLYVAAAQSVVKILHKRGTPSFPNDSIQLLIAGKIDGKLQLYRLEMSGIRISGDYSMPTTSRQYGYPGSRGHDGTDPKRGIEIIGLSDAVERFKAILPTEWSQGHDIITARRLVAIEASDSRAAQYVGSPLSTIVIDKNRTRWIDKGVCAWDPARHN